MPDYNDYLYSLGGGVTALVVMAATVEYGEHLKNLGIKPLITGIGPVQAASQLTYALSELRHALPDIIINLGSAGSATLEQGAVYQVSESGYRDMDASAFGFPKGQTPYSDHPPVVRTAAMVAGIAPASCCTGANVVGDHSATTAEMADMEYSALNEVAMKFGVPLIGFKGISDGKTPLTGELRQWTQLLPVIDKHLADAVIHIKTQLAGGHLKKEDLCRMPAHWKPEHGVFRAARGA